MTRTSGRPVSIAGMLMLCLATLLPSNAFAQLALPVAGHSALRIEGSNTLGAKLAPELVKGLMQREGLRNIRSEHSQGDGIQRISADTTSGQTVQVEIAAQGSGSGFSALAQQRAQLAAASRPIKRSEAEQLASSGDMQSDAAEQVIALDGVAAIVHPRSQLSQLSTAQLAGIFAGEITNWEQLGIQGGTIQVLAMDDNSGTFDSFNSAVLSATGKQLLSNVVRYSDNAVLAEDVAQTPQAIGFVGLAYIGKAKALAIADGQAEAMLPTLDSVASEDYSLSRRLYFYIKPNEQNPWAKALIEFAQSPAGQQVVANNGFVAQAVKAMPIHVNDKMPADYRQLVGQAQRLSVSFRFMEGSAKLDNKSAQDVQRLTHYLQANNKQVSLVGFGDAQEDPSRALLLSKLRAMAVRRELVKAGAQVNEVHGLGQIMPVASNELENGRFKNRRVEVWVY